MTAPDISGDLRTLIAELADELEQLGHLACTYGQFQTCTKSPDCVRRRQLVATARNDVLALLDDVDDLQRQLAQLTSVPELRRKTDHAAGRE